MHLACGNWLLRELVMIKLTVTFLLAVVACNSSFGPMGSIESRAQAETPRSLKPITPDSVKPHVVALADDSFEGRGAGYPGERKAADYIAREFKQIGLKPVGDSLRGRRSYFQEFKFQAARPTVAWQVLTSRNVLGLIEGNDPALKNEIVVIGAHYDGQGRSGQADAGPRFGVEQAKSANDDIWNSADDNAASVAAILEIARAIKSQKIISRRSVLFIAFGAEEHGVGGSMYYVSHPAFPLAHHIAMLNLEKLGRAPDRPFNVNATASSKEWTEILKAAQDETKTKVVPNVPFNVPDSDHYPFIASRVPALMLYVSAPSVAHFANDTADSIDFGRVAEAARFAMAVLLNLANRTQRPEYAASPIPDFGLIAHLASGEESDAKGLSAPQGGLKVTGVITGLPSADAGLQPADLILEFAGYKFRRDDNLSALMGLQREVLEGKRGNVLPLTIIRGSRRLDLTMTLRR